MPETKMVKTHQPLGTEIHDLIGSPPGWLLKSGMSVLGLVLIALLSLSSYVRYPDKISSPGIMTSETPPIEHVVRTGGIIDTLYVHHNDSVKKGDRILFIQNQGSIQDIMTLNLFISKYESIKIISNYTSLNFPTNLQFGEFQSEYAKLELSFMEFQMTLKQTGVWKKINILEDEISKTGELNTSLEYQKSLAYQELTLIEKGFFRNQSLNKSGVTSDLDMEKSKGELLNYQKQYAVLENGIIANQIKKVQQKLEIHTLKEERAILENSHLLKLREIISNLKQSITSWNRKYVVVAELAGIISIKSNIIQSVTVQSNQVIATILPPKSKSKRFVRTITLEKGGIGKIEIGDKVILKIDGYPHKEFGIVTSTVSSMSLLPEKDNNGTLIYEIIIPLPDTIKTNYGRIIPYNPNTGILAEIITEDKSIMHRIFNQFLDLLKNV